MDGLSNNNQSKISTGEDSFIFIVSYNLNVDKLSTPMWTSYQHLWISIWNSVDKLSTTLSVMFPIWFILSVEYQMSL